MNNRESSGKEVPTLKRLQSPKKRSNFAVDLQAKSSAELSRLFKIKQERVEKHVQNKCVKDSQGVGKVENRQPKTIMTAQSGGSCNNPLRKRLCLTKGVPSTSQNENQQSKSTSITSKMLPRQTLPTNMTQSRLTQMEAQGKHLTTPTVSPSLKRAVDNQVSNEKKRQSVIENVTQESNENHQGHMKARRVNAVCPAMSLDDFLKDNGVDAEEEAQEGDYGSNQPIDDDIIEQQVEEEEFQQEMINNEPEAQRSKVLKRVRGKTKCKEIHGRSLEERVEVVFVNRAAVGPTDKTVSDLSLFLGTIARNSKFCPLVYTSWKAIPECYTDRIMEYVQSKFIIPEEGKDWVLSGVREAWKRHKCKLKKKHFTPFDNVADMLKHRPKEIPIEVFKKMISFWSLPAIKQISFMNAENRKRQKWRHRMGPVNFARVRNHLSLENANDDVTQADLFITTRKGTKGKEVDSETQNAIDELEDRIQNSGENGDVAFQAIFGKEKSGRVRCFGRGVTKTSLKIDAEIQAVKRKHSEEIEQLKTSMDNRMDEMKGQIAGLENLLKAVLTKNSSTNINLEELAALVRSSPADENSAPSNGGKGVPHSSASTYVPSQEK